MLVSQIQMFNYQMEDTWFGLQAEQNSCIGRNGLHKHNWSDKNSFMGRNGVGK